MRIEFLSPQHHASLAELLLELNDFYNGSGQVTLSQVRFHLENNLVAETSTTSIAVAINEQETVIGFIAIIFQHSFVDPRPNHSRQCQIKELFVSQAARNQGAGDALVKWVTAFALKQGCHRMDWNVKSSNLAGIRFYERLGAKKVEDRISYRMDHAAMMSFADAQTATTV